MNAPAPDPAAPRDTRRFFTLWAWQSASMIGTFVTLFALNIWQTTTLFPRDDQKPQLAAALTATTLAFAIPTIFGAPLAGAFADRHDRRRIMIVANLVNAALSLALLSLLAGGRIGVPGAALMLAAYALAAAFHSAAFEASYVMLVPAEQLPRANAMMATSQALTGLVAPGLAAALIALPRLVAHLGGPLGALAARLPTGAPVAIALDLATFVAAASVLLRVPVPTPARTTPRASLGEDLAVGWRYLAGQPALLWLLSVFALANLSLGFFTLLTPLLVRFTFVAKGATHGLSYEPAYATLSTVCGLGGVAGGIVVAAWGGLRHHRVLGVLASMLVFALLMIGYGVTRTLVAACVLGALLQAVIPSLNAHSATLWQTRTPAELQGRVFSTRRMVAQGSFPLGTALAGALATRLDPGRVIATLGAVLAVFAAAQLANRPLMNLERAPAAPLTPATDPTARG